MTVMKGPEGAAVAFRRRRCNWAGICSVWCLKCKRQQLERRWNRTDSRWAEENQPLWTCKQWTALGMFRISPTSCHRVCRVMDVTVSLASLDRS